MPLVMANEKGIGQTEPGQEIDWECSVAGPSRHLTEEVEIHWKVMP